MHMNVGRDLKKSQIFKISHSTVWKIIYKWRTLKTTANMSKSGCPSKFSPRADRKMSSQDLQVTLAIVDVKVNASTIRTRLRKFDLHARCARCQKRKKNMARATAQD